MNALDSLKMDIDDYNELLKSKMDFLYWKIADLYKNYSKIDLNEINLEIEVIYDEIKLITCETRILRKMESYYELFEEEKKNTTDDFDFMEAFEKMGNRTHTKREIRKTGSNPQRTIKK